MIKKLIATLAVLGLLLCCLLFYTKYQLTLPVNISTPEIITIKSGTSVSAFTRKLEADGWIDNRFWIRSYVRLHPELTKIKSGTYKVEVGTSTLALIQKLVTGQEHQYSITFIEGSTFKEWLVKLNNHPHLTKQANFSIKDQDIAVLATKLGLTQKNPEGLFFPDTYTFTDNTPALEVLKWANQKMHTHLATLWKTRDANLPYESPYQALIMASIIEKESGQVSEQATISSVFVNRLSKRMRLQTDPTVIYGLGDRYKGDITYAHLREKTAYNTYRINGLPPTPIAMPGLTALTAAMHPESTDYYYFVSRGNGYHKFSKTLKEHNRAVKKYILRTQSK